MTYITFSMCFLIGEANMEFLIYTPLLIPGVNLPKDVFVSVYGYPEYEININGIVRNSKTSEIKIPIRTKKLDHVYLEVDLWRNNKPRRTGIHRLLALTFLPHSVDLRRIVINHLDGNTENNTLSNLEVTDHSGNLDHAYETGLRKDNVHVVCCSVDTHVTHGFRSWHKLAEFLQTTPQSVHWHWQKYGISTPIKGYYVKRADSTAPWPDTPGKTRDTRKPVTLIEKLTNTRIECVSVNAAASIMGINSGRANYYLTKYGKVENEKYVAKFTNGPVNAKSLADIS